MSDRKRPRPGYAIGRNRGPWTETERAAIEQEIREIVPDFDARRGAVAIGPPPEAGMEGSWLRVTFRELPSGEAGNRLHGWFDEVSYDELEQDGG